MRLYIKNTIKGLIAFTLLFLASCSSHQPKPRGYFRIDLPDSCAYDTFSNSRYPFTFEYPDSIAKIVFKEKKENDPYGLNIIYPHYRACIYCDYKPVAGNFQTISEDFRNFVYKHTVKADAITEQPFANEENKVWGILYELKGSTASQVQFVLTDSTNHFFRGALYFNVPPNPDSIAPVADYITKDIRHIVETFHWKKAQQ